jgi:serine/threonine-protein kinase
MEYLDGQTLTQLIKSAAPLRLEAVVAIARQAAGALNAAHQIGIVHRDFKPDNVVICQQSDGSNWVKVLDFGVAKPTAVDPQFQSLTQTGFVVGTPQYMSPEQVKNETLSARSDLYSLAVVVYQMITGGLPFAGKLPQQQMFNRLLEDPLPFSVVNPALTLPPEVEMVLMKGLSRQSAERHATTLEFADALAFAALPRQDNWAASNPIEAARPVPAEAPGQGRKSLLPLIVAAVIIVAVGLIVAGVYLVLSFRP